MRGVPLFSPCPGFVFHLVHPTNAILRALKQKNKSLFASLPIPPCLFVRLPTITNTAPKRSSLPPPHAPPA